MAVSFSKAYLYSVGRFNIGEWDGGFLIASVNAMVDCMSLSVAERNGDSVVLGINSTVSLIISDLVRGMYIL